MIAIVIVGETGNVLQTFDDPLVADSLCAAATESSICLRFIDPWGDTIFNCLQLPVLLQEIRAVASLVVDQEQLARYRLIERFVDTAIGLQPHVYLKFIGD